MGESLEDYLEAILVMQNKKSLIRSVDLAQYRGYSRSSISYAVKELKNKGYLIMNNDGHLKLTPLGLKLAHKIYERHCFFKEQLTAAGVEPDLAEIEACKMEHGISDDSFEKLKNYFKRKGILNTNNKES